ncbi:hypothetical protein E4T56_gene19368 [Termitomyces sp. T112]|nr:hypothetical protein E4T56_gene19368 [Termitomyces sp. T112]
MEARIVVRKSQALQGGSSPPPMSTPSLTAADERIGKSACEEILPPTSLETLAIDFPSNIEGLSVSKVPEDWLWSENYRQLWKKAPTV